MPEGSTTHMGGTMRLGARRTFFKTQDCKAEDAPKAAAAKATPDAVKEFKKGGALTAEAIEELSYKQLQRACKERGISAKGGTAVLQDRLKEYTE